MEEVRILHSPLRYVLSEKSSNTYVFRGTLMSAFLLAHQESNLVLQLIFHIRLIFANYYKKKKPRSNE